MILFDCTMRSDAYSVRGMVHGAIYRDCTICPTNADRGANSGAVVQTLCTMMASKVTFTRKNKGVARFGKVLPSGARSAGRTDPGMFVAEIEIESAIGHTRIKPYQSTSRKTA